MNPNTNNDINDNEIRIITQCGQRTDLVPAQKKQRSSNSVLLLIALGLIFIAVVTLLVLYLTSGDSGNEAEEQLVIEQTEPTTLNPLDQTPAPPDTAEILRLDTPSEPGHVNITDARVGETTLKVLQPRNLTPELCVGPENAADTTAALIVQAADVRADNGGIVGAYVFQGELLSRGQSKSGFCAIIGGNPIIGVADATPYLEQAIETNGYFFRQYPLVVSGQIVENRQPGKSLRKALAELSGEICVILSEEPMTFHDFSQSLIDLGVTNAIYLVGSTSYGYARDAQGRRISFGKRSDRPLKNTNYIVWR